MKLLRLCVEFIIVNLKLFNISKINFFESSSKFEVDSSKINKSTSISRALIKDIFCICPDDKDLFETSESRLFSSGVLKTENFTKYSLS